MRARRAALAASSQRAAQRFAALHADQSWLTPPYPEVNQLLTICWTTDKFNRQSGTTKVIPGSHAHRRQPNADEGVAEVGAIPMACPADSLVCWNGSIWHGNYPREVDGERVGLHMTFCRLALRPVENYGHLDEAWLAGKPLALRTLLGRDDFLGKSTFAGPDGRVGATIQVANGWD